MVIRRKEWTAYQKKTKRIFIIDAVFYLRILSIALFNNVEIKSGKNINQDSVRIFILFLNYLPSFFEKLNYLY